MIKLKIATFKNLLLITRKTKNTYGKLYSTVSIFLFSQKATIFQKHIFIIESSRLRFQQKVKAITRLWKEIQHIVIRKWHQKTGYSESPTWIIVSLWCISMKTTRHDISFCVLVVFLGRDGTVRRYCKILRGIHTVLVARWMACQCLISLRSNYLINDPLLISTGGRGEDPFT